ncbi:hypothetical protein LTS18_010911 [Coniosporium uncinatum]|uniref:Uncharacterized protein n=1 Tax=Coniosporium uncinatum TaxID=93489 RepID=A0ACC3CZ83_9PEZI|nr:hypothetical protein LTS18_010911 [Coniosporium uncinatum]
MKEWTTGHPKVDPVTGEMILFHCTFIPPYIHYSVIPTESASNGVHGASFTKLLNKPVPGVSGAKMMHDFGVSSNHTVIMDLPLSLDPVNNLKGLPVVSYDSSKPSRFGVFPRRDPTQVRWFETDACCIFHTANTWDSLDSRGNAEAVNMLACRLTSATLVFSAGNITAPQPTPKTVTKVEKSRRPSFFSSYDAEFQSRFSDPEKSPEIRDEFTESDYLLPGAHSTANIEPSLTDADDEQCRLYYLRMPLLNNPSNHISHQFALSAVPFEFPSTHPSLAMHVARYIYGCSVSTSGSFGAALGKAAKIDVIMKMDAHALLARAEQRPPKSVTGCVDTRSVPEVLASTDPCDSIKAFKFPPGIYGQEPRFVPRHTNTGSPEDEDDGFLLFYTFDEAQLNDEGECPLDAVSELWVLDPRNMKDVLCKIRLPQRVPYGLHGNWFTEEEIKRQRAVERVRHLPEMEEGGVWQSVRRRLIKAVG